MAMSENAIGGYIPDGTIVIPISGKPCLSRRRGVQHKQRAVLFLRKTLIV